MIRPGWFLLGSLSLLLTASIARQAHGTEWAWSQEVFEDREVFREIPATWERIIRGQESIDDEPLATDRPDFTEASSVVGRRVLQIETGYTYFHDDEDGVRTRTHSLPETLFRLGISDNIELRLVWNYLWEETVDSGGRQRRDGADDLIVGTKLALTSQDGLRPESAIILHVVTPTGGAPFSNRHTELRTNYCYGWDLSDDKSLAGSFGYGTASDFPTFPGISSSFDRYNVFHASVTHGFAIAESVNMYIEYFGLYYDELEEGRPENYIDSGLTYLPNNDLQYDIRFGAGLNEAAIDFFAGTGVSVRF